MEKTSTARRKSPFGCAQGKKVKSQKSKVLYIKTFASFKIVALFTPRCTSS
ncbi:hypothetical protein GXM_05506 [Nostoc sphaeroides CCNUC1]|uniref:Uncharacterized protein n=1 Tax=Nostoc sphaeroides CCNUC1 TaxID=2653204 RepID=A0A5P8W5U0_9NOSO|nr:hypothetical protein GXM_05506 [Nostoc sphaeroides CCNUC1]